MSAVAQLAQIALQLMVDGSKFSAGLKAAKGEGAKSATELKAQYERLKQDAKSLAAVAEQSGTKAARTAAEEAKKAAAEAKNAWSDALEAQKAKLQALSGQLGAVRNAAAIAFGAGVMFLKSFADEASGSEGRVLRLKATLRGLGDQFVAETPRVMAWADGLRQASDFDDDDIIAGFRTLVGMTGSVEKAMLSMEAATNLANSAGTDLNTGVQALITGYSGMTRTLKTTFGVVLPEGTKGFQVIEAAMKKVDGQNKLTADSNERAMRRMGNDWGDTKEKLGNSLLPMLTQLARAVSSNMEAFNKLSPEQQKSYSDMLLYGTALAGVVMVGATAYKWIVDFRLAMIALSLATKGATASNRGFAASSKMMVGGINPITIAVLALAAAWTHATMEAQKYQKNAGGNAGTDGTGGPYIMTERGLQSVKEIDDESAMASWEVGAAKVWAHIQTAIDPRAAAGVIYNQTTGNEATGLMYDPYQRIRDYNQARQRDGDANETIARLKEQVAQAKANRQHVPGGGHSSAQADDVRSQLRGIMR